jgi:hypothetical protein
LDFSNVSEAEILADETFHELFDDPNEIARTNNINALRKRAKEFHLTTEFDDKVRAYKRAAKEQKAAELARQREERARLKQERMAIAHMTEFTGLEQIDAHNVECTPWTADDSGVLVDDFARGVQIACPHPILPIKRLKNIQTGAEKITIAYKRDFDRWQTAIFPADLLCSASKITALANYGVLVTSESAKALVKYIADVQARNGADVIEVQQSSSKFGWIKPDIFLPYDEDSIEFDSDSRFSQLTEAIAPHGDVDIWLSTVRSIRLAAPGSLQIRLMMSAALASVLLCKVNALPFIINLGGNTEGGKTVTLMVCASLFADPAENRYIGDFKATDTALETKADALNNLPMILDDTAKVSKRIRDNFEGFVYDMTSGKGKSRSNRDLGFRYENSWSLVTLTTGEGPLSGFVTQGGALNRILEVKAPDRLFDNPHEVVESVKRNFGFAGRVFVNKVKQIGEKELNARYNKILEEVKAAAGKSMQKQAMSLAAVLLADRIAEECIFQDDILIDPRDAVGCLADPSEVSAGERAYNLVIDLINMNASKFDESNDVTETWGVLNEDEKMVYIYPAALAGMCQREGLSKDALVDWAITNNLLVRDPRGKAAIVKKIAGNSKRVYAFRLPDLEAEEREFEEAGDIPITFM